MNVDFGFAMISIKKTGGKNVIFVFFYDVKNGHFCSCPNSNADILQKSLIFFIIGYLNLKDFLVNGCN